MSELLTQQSAVFFVQNLLRSSLRVGFHPFQRSGLRHTWLRCTDNLSLASFYVVYKGDSFKFFSKVFKDHVQQDPFCSCEGESLNVEYLHRLKALKVDYVLFVYRDESVLGISVPELFAFCKFFDLKRVQKDGEVTYCFPLSRLKSLDELLLHPEKVYLPEAYEDFSLSHQESVGVSLDLQDENLGRWC